MHPYHRARVQIQTPLDFLVVSDYAEFLGGIRDTCLDCIQAPDPGFIESIAYWYKEREIRSAIDEGRGAAYFACLLQESEDPMILSPISKPIPTTFNSGRSLTHPAARYTPAPGHVFECAFLPAGILKKPISKRSSRPLATSGASPWGAS